MKCEKCGCNAFKPMSDEYSICWNCGKLSPLCIEVMPMPTKEEIKEHLGIKEFCKRGHRRETGNVSKKGACILCERLLYEQKKTDPEYKAKQKAYQKAYRGKAIEREKGEFACGL